MSEFENTPSSSQIERHLEPGSFKIPEGFESRFTELDSVRIQGFEGPLDLLLFLIKDQKLNILDLPMAQITQAGEKRMICRSKILRSRHHALAQS